MTLSISHLFWRHVLWAKRVRRTLTAYNIDRALDRAYKTRHTPYFLGENNEVDLLSHEG